MEKNRHVMAIGKKKELLLISKPWLFCCFVFLLLFPLIGNAKKNKDILRHSYPIQVIKVIDGDTISVRVPIWLGQMKEIDIRLKGVDTPEIQGRCHKEIQKAKKAKRFVKKWVKRKTLYIKNIEPDKYGSRVLADLYHRKSNPQYLSKLLLKKGLAKPYYGGQKLSWCE